MELTFKRILSRNYYPRRDDLDHLFPLAPFLRDLTRVRVQSVARRVTQESSPILRCSCDLGLEGDP